jgi:DNA polymerase III subunit beta
MAKSRLTGTPPQEENLERTVKKKRSTATAHNSAKTVKKSVKPTTETDSVCEPLTTGV